MTSKRERIQLEQDLALKLNLFEAVNCKREEAKKTLHKINAQQRRIELEIECIRASLAAINRVPNEILCCIFKFAICPNDFNSSEVKAAVRCRGNILLVCKEWHHLTTNTASLWRLVLVTDPPTESVLSQLTWFESRQVSLEAQLSRSKDALLDVVVDFLQMQQVGTSISDDIRSVVPSSADGVHEWLSTIPFDEFPESWYIQLYKELLGVLIGKKGSRMRTWRSLRLTLPKWSPFGPHIWNLFIGETPNLTYLDLSGPTTDLMEAPGYSLAFSYLSSVTELTTSALFSLDAAPFCHRVRKLTLILDYEFINWTDLPSISRFLSLEELCIHYTDDYWEPSPIESIPIPSLSRLTLCGSVPSPVVDALEIDRLSKFTIREEYFPFESTPQFNLLSSAECVEVALTFKHDENKRKHMVSHVTTQARNARSIEFSYMPGDQKNGIYT